MKDEIVITENTTIDQLHKIKVDSIVREGDRQGKVISNQIVYLLEDNAYEVVIILQNGERIYKIIHSDFFPNLY
jgi:hypothetical protein